MILILVTITWSSSPWTSSVGFVVELTSALGVAEESSWLVLDMLVRVLSSTPEATEWADGVTGKTRLFGVMLALLDPDPLLWIWRLEELGDLCLSSLDRLLEASEAFLLLNLNDQKVKMCLQLDLTFFYLSHLLLELGMSREEEFLLAEFWLLRGEGAELWEELSIL